MAKNTHRLLASLSLFGLEVLPWVLSGMIGIYLIWGFYSGPAASPDGHLAMTQSAVGGTRIASVSLFTGESR
jgi:hypothetical protein